MFVTDLVISGPIDVLERLVHDFGATADAFAVRPVESLGQKSNGLPRLHVPLSDDEIEAEHWRAVREKLPSLTATITHVAGAGVECLLFVRASNATDDVFVREIEIDQALLKLLAEANVGLRLAVCPTSPDEDDQ